MFKWLFHTRGKQWEPSIVFVVSAAALLAASAFAQSDG
jgi:hypothetical protein